MKTIFILLTTFAASILNSSENSVEEYQSCNAELTVHKNRSFKSANQDGATFKLTLKNTSSKTQTYFLSTSNLSEPCNNKGRSSSTSNVALNTSIEDFNQKRNSLNEITLSGGSSYEFAVKVTVPVGTRYNSWSCIEVEAKASECTSNSFKTILSVFVPDPSEG